MTRSGGPLVTIADLDLSPPEVLDHRCTLQEAAIAMINARATAVLLRGEHATILTELDLVRASALGRDPGSPAAPFATPEPVRIDRATPLVEAMHAMVRNGVRHLVVVDDADRITGILSVRAAANALLPTAELPPWLPALRLALRVEWRDGDITVA